MRSKNHDRDPADPGQVARAVYAHSMGRMPTRELENALREQGVLSPIDDVLASPPALAIMLRKANGMVIVVDEFGKVFTAQLED